MFDLALAPATSGSCLRRNLVAALEGGAMNVSAKEPVAVVGIGRTEHVVPRKTVPRGPRPRGPNRRGAATPSPCRSQAGRDCAADLYRQTGITDLCRQIDAVEMYVLFSWDEPLWLKNLGFAAEGDCWRLTEAGVTELDDDLPVDMSGGVLSTNPIGTPGLIRFAEAPFQVPGPAGEHQVDAAHKVLGHAFGRRGSRLFSMWVAGSEPPTG